MVFIFVKNHRSQYLLHVEEVAATIVRIGVVHLEMTVNTGVTFCLHQSVILLLSGVMGFDWNKLMVGTPIKPQTHKTFKPLTSNPKL